MNSAALARFWAWCRQPGPEPWRSPHAPPEDASQLGEQAKRLLEDPVLQLAFDRVQAKLIESWKHTAAGQVEAREAAYRLLWASEQLKSELRVMIGNAAMSGLQ